MSVRYDAVIVGGGIAGTTCAILLAQAGGTVALIEKQAFPRRKVCGECIAASNLHLFDALGIGAQLRALAGAPLRRVAWCAGDAMIEAPLPRRSGSAHAWGCAIGREHLDTLLLERAREAGVRVLQPCTLRTLDDTPTRQRCIATDAGGRARRIDADVVIDAHGSWQRSPFDRRSQLPPADATDLFAFKANFSSSRLPAGLLPVLAFDGGYGGMVQADHGLLTLACCIRHDRLRLWRAQHPGLPAGAAVESLLRSHLGAVRDALEDAHREGAWLGVGPIQPRIRTARPGRHVFAAGNAAGEAHPILGEGISMAVQSAFMLCERLIAGDRKALDGYADAWRRAFVPRIRLAALCAQIAMRPRSTRLALAALEKWPGLLALCARLGGKVSCAADAQRVLSLLAQAHGRRS